MAERLIFYLLIFSVPFQGRLILWQWTRPFNEWTAGFIYGTDFLILTLLFLWFGRWLKWWLGGRKEINWKLLLKVFRVKPDLFLIIFLLIAAVSILGVKIEGLAWYRWFKLLEFSFFYFYLKSNWKRFNIGWTALVILASGFFQSLIAIGQYWKQAALGLKIFGESPINLITSNVAIINTAGQKYLRAYGTTGHPNVLAAWLLVAVFVFYFWYFRQTKNSKPASLKVIWLFLFVYGISLWGLFLTFSRIIIGLWGITFLLGAIQALMTWRKDIFKKGRSQIKIKQVGWLVGFSISVAFLFSIIFWPQVRSRLTISFQEEAINYRVLYGQAAGNFIADKPIFGLGPGQFVPKMLKDFSHYPAIFYQPVHNIYLLIASETGFLGIGMFLTFLIFFIFQWPSLSAGKPGRFGSVKSLFFCLLAAGFFDHFLWTSQPGNIIFWSVLAVASIYVPEDYWSS